MPAKKPTPATMPSEDLVLAAIDRAYRHRTNQQNPGVLLADVKTHLGLPRSGAATLRLRPIWENLQTLGLIEQFRLQGNLVWNLTPAGHRRLTAATKTSDLTLPESPQHSRWKTARTEAAQLIDTLREDLRAALADATRLLANDSEATSTDWYALGERVNNASARLASATHCLTEWPEPDDSTADIDTPPPLRAGRRDYHAWAER
jgi:hypothetical protein